MEEQLQVVRPLRSREFPLRQVTGVGKERAHDQHEAGGGICLFFRNVQRQVAFSPNRANAVFQIGGSGIKQTSQLQPPEALLPIEAVLAEVSVAPFPVVVGIDAVEDAEVVHPLPPLQKVQRFALRTRLLAHEIAVEARVVKERKAVAAAVVGVAELQQAFCCFGESAGAAAHAVNQVVGQVVQRLERLFQLVLVGRHIRNDDRNFVKAQSRRLPDGVPNRVGNDFRLAAGVGAGEDFNAGVLRQF